MLRHKHISIPVFFFMCLIVSSLSFSQTPEYKDYTVTKGDTLWDISENELKDPFLWPKVWKENPEIKNPDLIYPGQKIRIPLYLLQKEIKPAVQPEMQPEIQPEIKPEVRVERKPAPVVPKPVQKTVTPAPREYLINKNLLIVSGYITDSVHSVGAIYDKPGDITNLTAGDYAYVSTDSPMKKGDKFYVIYPVEEVRHPVTNRRLGTRIAILGTAEMVDEHDPKILITTSYSEIPMGSLLDNYYEIEPPLAMDNPRKPDVNGHVVTALRRIYAHGNWDIVFIDKGENDGLAPGDLLATTWQSNHKILNGVVQIISTKPSTSAAIIRKAAREIQIGDPVIPITQE